MGENREELTHKFQIGMPPFTTLQQAPVMDRQLNVGSPTEIIQDHVALATNTVGERLHNAGSRMRELGIKVLDTTKIPEPLSTRAAVGFAAGVVAVIGVADIARKLNTSDAYGQEANGTISPDEAKKYCEETTFISALPELRARYVRRNKGDRKVMTRIMNARINDHDPNNGVGGTCSSYERKPRDYLIWRVQGPAHGKLERVSPKERITLEDGDYHGSNVFYSDVFQMRAKPPRPGTREKVRIRERRYPIDGGTQSCTITHNTYPWSSKHRGVPTYRCNKKNIQTLNK